MISQTFSGKYSYIVVFEELTIIMVSLHESDVVEQWDSNDFRSELLISNAKDGRKRETLLIDQVHLWDV